MLFSAASAPLRDNSSGYASNSPDLLQATLFVSATVGSLETAVGMNREPREPREKKPPNNFCAGFSLPLAHSCSSHISRLELPDLNCIPLTIIFHFAARHYPGSISIVSLRLTYIATQCMMPS
jgi:hypothetical protein